MPSPRIKKFMEVRVPKHFTKDSYVSPVYLSILRSRAMTEVFKATEGEPATLRKAMAISKYLDTMPLFIRPEDTIVGFYAEDPKAMPLSIEATSPAMVRQMIKDGYTNPEDNQEWEEILNYWDKRGLNHLVRSMLTEEELKLAQAENAYMEVLPTQYTSRAQAEYDLVLDYGIKGLIEILQDKFDRLAKEREEADGKEGVEIARKMIDLKAMIMSAVSVIRLAKRYSEFAKNLASQEKDPARKQELLDIAERCAYVPENPPRNFKEAVQSYWLTFQVAHMIEYLSHGTSQRLDQIFWPWFKKDMQAGTLKREEALDLMEEFLLKVDEMGRPLPVVRRKALQGSNFLATYTIGGVDNEGKDACNDITMIILESLEDLKIAHPDFKFRWHPKVDPKIYQKAIDVIALGIGQPSIKNDEVVIDTLVSHFGFTLEEARSWAVVGCISPAPTINWGRARRDAWAVRPAKCLELTLFNGINPLNGEKIGIETGDPRNFKSFDELFAAYTKQFALAMKRSARIKSIAEECENELCKRPFLSVLYRRCHESCRDVMDTKDKGMPWVNDPGIVDSIDSLIGIKKFIYDDKKYTLDELLKALKADWKGYEVMRQEFINGPKYGNNNDYADEVAIKTYNMVAEEMSKVKDYSGASPMPSGLIVTWMFELASKTGALPNGRKLGDPLADAGISPHSSYDKNGPMAAVISASKIDHRKQKANIFNQKFSPNSIQGTAGREKLRDYVTASMNLGLDMIQFNVVDGKVLKEAQKTPERYKDLVVRISGYNAHFVELDKFVQDAVIERTEHML